MAVTIPIISEFDGKGISRAIKEFDQLETIGQKAQFALRKAALPAAAAMGALAVGIGAATRAAMEDAAAQDQLAGVLRRTTGATDAQIEANEQFISSLSRATAIADDQLRPALTELVNTTGSLKASQDILTQATDIAAATNTDLSTVVDALSKAYGGNLKGLQALDPSLRAAIKEGANFSEVMAILADKTGGAAAAATETAAGKMALLKITLDETKESIGAAFIPVLEKLLPYLQDAADFVARNTEAVTIAAVAIGGLATAVLLANAALKTYNTYIAVSEILTRTFGTTSKTATIFAGNFATKLGALAIVAATVALVIDSFRDKTAFTDFVNLGVRAANILIDAFEAVANSVVIAVNAINSAINALLPGNPIPLFPKVSIPNVPMMQPPAGGGNTGTVGGAAPPGVRGGLGAIVPALPEIALPSLGGRGGGGKGGSGGGGGGGFSTTPFPQPLPPDLPPGSIGRPEDLLRTQGTVINNVTVNTVTAPEGLGQEIVDALRYYNRANGPIDIVVAA